MIPLQRLKLEEKVSLFSIHPERRRYSKLGFRLSYPTRSVSCVAEDQTMNLFVIQDSRSLINASALCLGCVSPKNILPGVKIDLSVLRCCLIRTSCKLSRKCKLYEPDGFCPFCFRQHVIWITTATVIHFASHTV